MNIRVLIIARDSNERHIYSEAFRRLEVDVTAASSLRDLNENETGLFYHGVAIDMPTKIYALKKDRDFIYTTLRKFPVAHLSLEKDTGKPRVYYPGQSPGATLIDFINEECRAFTPRRLAHHIRKDLHLNVILAREKDTETGDVERTVTVDVSEGGCFVFSVFDWTVGDTARLTIMELSDQTPIRAHVRRHVQWGKGMQVPGVGLEFSEINELQRRELSNMLWE